MQKAYFRHERVSDHCIRIIGAAEEMMYLILGQKKAVLLDSGTGLGNIRNYVQTLTNLPVEVYLTHGHLDHAGGAGCFDYVHMAMQDLEIFREHASLEKRKEFVDMCLLSEGVTVSELPPLEEYVPNCDAELTPVQVGDIIELGGLTLEILDGSGHTKGSVCFLDREHQELYLGDAVNGRMFLFLPECSSVEEYLCTLTNLSHVAKECQHLYIFHHPGEITMEYFENLTQCCHDIMQGRADDILFDFLGNTGYLAKKADMQGNREDGKLGNMVYAKNHIWKEMDNE